MNSSLVFLQKGMIDFVPALPADKVASFGACKMLSGSKTIACFRERLWPLDCGLIFCVNETFSQASNIMQYIN